MTRTYKLILQTGPEAGKEFTLEKAEVFMGRDTNNDIMINDPEISRRHARLIREGDDYLYEDLGSTNGTFIQGQRLAAPTLLKHGMILTIGERVMISYMIAMSDPFATVAVSRPAATAVPQQASAVPEPPKPPLQVPPAQTPPLQTPPSYVPPVYSQPPAYTPPPPTFGPQPPVMNPAPKKKSKALMIILIILAVLLVFCIIPWIIVEVTNSYCSLFPGFFNAIQAGACS
jgi:predicted component of type VI protein secretion system